MEDPIFCEDPVSYEDNTYITCILCGEIVDYFEDDYCLECSLLFDVDQSEQNVDQADEQN
jgi:hypothetical protein